MSCRKQPLIGFSLILLWVGMGSISLSAASWGATHITSIDFKGGTTSSELDIQADGPFTYTKQENVEDRQIILEIQGATISKNNARQIDTSSFNSNVSLISPYQVQGQPNTVRIAVQLRQPGLDDVNQNGNALQIHFPNPPTNISPVLDSAPASTSAVPSNSSLNLTPNGIVPQQKSKLEELMTDQATQKFNGKPITLQVRDAEVTDVLRLIGEASGFNIIVGDDVKGKITLSLVDVPWDQALDVVLHTLHLGAERNNSVLRVVTLQNLTNEKMDELKAKQASDANSPRITRVIPINYAKLQDLQTILTKFSSSGTTGGATSGGASTFVQIDNRTNSLIIRDLPETISRMVELVKMLDYQPPQVIIEAKVVEATEEFTKNLGGSLGLGFGPSNLNYFASFAGGDPIDPLVGSPGVFSSGSAIGSQSGGTPLNGTFGLSPALGFIPGGAQLNALLSLGESESQVKIVSTPKTVVLNKEQATILEGTPVLVAGSTTVNGVGTVPMATVQSANISLKVTPTITNDSSVLMNLYVTKDIAVPLAGGQNGIGQRNLQTWVLVESGSTLVIGGIYTMQTDHTASGFPILRNLPIIGALFGSDASDMQRTELFIFLTPRVLNPKEAGLSS